MKNEFNGPPADSRIPCKNNKKAVVNIFSTYIILSKYLVLYFLTIHYSIQNLYKNKQK